MWVQIPLAAPKYGGVPERFIGAALKADGPPWSRGFESYLHRHLFRDRLIGRTACSELVDPGSNPGPGTSFAPLMELAYILGLEPRLCGFDSHKGHQFGEFP